MGEFFKGWRRKAGCVTLALACVLTAMWMRSQMLTDQVVVNVSGHDFRMASFHGRIACSYWSPGCHETASTRWVTSKVGAEFRYGTSLLEKIGFSYKPVDDGRCQRQQVMLPNWSLIFPLTLLSAWLLLSKPRPKKPPLESP